MTTYSFDDSIPDAANNPSQDQPLMKINNQSTAALIDVDHYGFNVANGGYHDVIHQPPVLANPAAIPGIGQTFTKTVSGDQQLFYESGNGVVSQLSANQAIISGSIGLTAAFQTVATLPPDCVGFIVIQTPAFNICNTLSFFSVASTLYVQIANVMTNSNDGIVTAQPSSLDLQIARLPSVGDYTAAYKIIYWAG